MMGGGGFDDDVNFGDIWDDDGDAGPPGNFFNKPRNQRYSNAYGDYRGGYGPSGGFGGPPRGGPPRGGPPLGFGPPPPNLFGPPPPGCMPFRPGAPGPDFMWGRRIRGPGGPPGPFRKPPSREERSMKFLLRCGVSMENLRNLPKEFFHLIEPQFCGVCSMDLTSPSISRVHYVSKNHLKNQRKWLALKREAGPRAKEVPFKARELYCELCDVHITSKSHGDSHYAGKAHRAVVEGRKQPKNPILLQKNKQERLEQLIRREKKNMKTTEPTTNKEVEVEEEPKATDPDLYCDICKTSVTCSEQMTMHLNGKKHLTKEKRHIFEMMKGKNTNGNEEDGDGENAEKEENGDEEGGEAENDDDIGNEEWPAEES